MSSPSESPDAFPYNFPEAPLGIRAAVIVLGSLYVLFAMVFTSILFFRRHHKMLRPRSPPLLVFFSLFLMYTVVLNAVSFVVGKSYTCLAMDFLYLMISYFMFYFILSPFTLLIMDKAQREKHQYSATKHRLLWKLERCVTQLRWKLLGCLLVFVLLLAIYFGVRYTIVFPGDCSRGALVISSAIILALFVVSLPAHVIWTKRLGDPYYWRMEIAMFGLLAVPSTICLFVYAWGPAVFSERFDVRWINLYFAFTANLVCIVFPVLLTFPFFEAWIAKMMQSKKKVTDVELAANKTEKFLFSLSKIDELQAVMENQILREAFKEFCGIQWCMENILFLQDVETFKTDFQKDSPATKELGDKIITEYVSRGSPLELNISSRLRRDAIEAFYEDIGPNIFNGILAEVREMVKSDTLNKWHQTEHFKATLRRAVINNSSASGSHGALEIPSK